MAEQSNGSALDRRQHGIVPKQWLGGEVFKAIEALVEACERHDGVRLKLERELMPERPPDEINDFCFYEGGALAGYLSFDPAGSPIEITGMVHPDHRRRGIGRALVGAAVKECRRRKATRLLIVGVRASASGAPFAASIGAVYTISEYRMELDATYGRPSFAGPVQLRQARPADAAQLARIHGECFEQDERQAQEYAARALAEPGSRVYFAILEMEPIGAIGAILEAGRAYLRGFGVLPAHRGKGHGRQILSAIVASLAAGGHAQLALDVETGNSNALGLYQSCGFQQTNCYDYYKIEL